MSWKTLSSSLILLLFIIISIIHFLVIIVIIIIIDFTFLLLLLLLLFLLLPWLMQDPGLLPEALLRRMVARTSMTGKVAEMTAAQMQLAWEDSMASSSAMTTALVVVVSASSVATSPHTADDDIQANTVHAVAYAAAALHAAPVAEVTMSKLLSCCHTKYVLHGNCWGNRPCLHTCWVFAMCIYQMEFCHTDRYFCWKLVAGNPLLPTCFVGVFPACTLQACLWCLTSKSGLLQVEQPWAAGLLLHGILPRTSLTAQLAFKAAAQLQRGSEAHVGSQEAPSTALLQLPAHASFGDRAAYCTHVEDGACGAGSLHRLQAAESLAAQVTIQMLFLCIEHIVSDLLGADDTSSWKRSAACSHC